MIFKLFQILIPFIKCSEEFIYFFNRDGTQSNTNICSYEENSVGIPTVVLILNDKKTLLIQSTFKQKLRNTHRTICEECVSKLIIHDNEGHKLKLVDMGSNSHCKVLIERFQDEYNILMIEAEDKSYIPCFVEGETEFIEVHDNGVSLIIYPQLRHKTRNIVLEDILPCLISIDRCLVSMNNDGTTQLPEFS